MKLVGSWNREWIWYFCRWTPLSPRRQRCYFCWWPSSLSRLVLCQHPQGSSRDRRGRQEIHERAIKMFLDESLAIPPFGGNCVNAIAPTQRVCWSGHNLNLCRWKQQQPIKLVVMFAKRSVDWDSEILYRKIVRLYSTSMWRILAMFNVRRSRNVANAILHHLFVRFMAVSLCR